MISILSEIIAPVLGVIWLIGGAIILLLLAKQSWPRVLAIAGAAMVICGGIILNSDAAEVRLYSLAVGALIGGGVSWYALKN